MLQVPNFSSISFICYAQDSIHDPKFTGPKQRAKYLKERGLEDAGSDLSAAKKHHASLRRQADQQRDYEMNKAIIEAIAPHDVFTRNPNPLPQAPPAGSEPPPSMWGDV